MIRFLFAAFVFAGVGFWLGTQQNSGPTICKAPEQETLEGVEGEFARISKEDLREYQNLKDAKEKYDKANLILAKVMKIFIADLGLKTSGAGQCKLETKVLSETAPPLVTPQVPAPPVDTQPKPTASSETAPTRSSRLSERARATSTNGVGNSRNTRWGPVEPEKAKGAVHALYQAILWRAPDQGGGEEATRKMSEQGWSEYTRNARAMIRSSEFLRDIEPNHSPQQIIARMYSVYFGRCPFSNEMSQRLSQLRSSGPGEVISSVINVSRRRHQEQIMSGGFPPNSCKDL